MTLTKKEIENLIPWRSRGLDDLSRRVGDIQPLIDEKLKTSKKVKILELGFGFGGCHMELGKRYGSRVELYGINKLRSHGDWELIKRVAIKKGLFSQKDIAHVTKPTLLYRDVSKGIPFKENAFDIVCSRVSFMYFEDKAKVLE